MRGQNIVFLLPKPKMSRAIDSSVSIEYMIFIFEHIIDNFIQHRDVQKIDQSTSYSQNFCWCLVKYIQVESK